MILYFVRAFFDLADALFVPFLFAEDGVAGCLNAIVICSRAQMNSSMSADRSASAMEGLSEGSQEDARRRRKNPFAVLLQSLCQSAGSSTALRGGGHVLFREGGRRAWYQEIMSRKRCSASEAFEGMLSKSFTLLVHCLTAGG